MIDRKNQAAVFVGFAGLALLLPWSTPAQEEHHHSGAHLQVINVNKNGRNIVLISAFDGRDERLGEALQESLEQAGYKVSQNLKFAVGDNGKKIPRGAGLRISDARTGTAVFEAKSDFFYPNYPSQVIGHEHEAPGVDAVVGILRDIVEKRSECQRITSQPVASPFFDKNDDARAVVSPISKLPLCAEPYADMELLRGMGKALENLRSLIEEKKFSDASLVLAGEMN